MAAHLVIFGCGYLGRRVALEGVRRGMRVTALTRNAETAAELRAAGVAHVVESELQSAQWHSRIGPADYLLNAVSSGRRGAEAARESYVLGMQSIADWARLNPSGTLVSISSTSVYPQSAGERVDESADTSGCGPAGRLQLEAEALAQSAAGFRRWFILRLAGIYGPGRHAWIDALRQGQRRFPAAGRRRLNLIHADDAAAGIWRCFEAPETVSNLILNLADDSPTTKEDVIAWLAQELGLPSPEFVESADTRSVSRRTESGAWPDRAVSAEQAKRVLGWQPRFNGFRDGYRGMGIGRD